MSLAIIVNLHLNGNEPKLQTNPTSKTFYAASYPTCCYSFCMSPYPTSPGRYVSLLDRIEIPISPRRARISWELLVFSILHCEHNSTAQTFHQESPQKFLFLGYWLLPPSFIDWQHVWVGPSRHSPHLQLPASLEPLRLLRPGPQDMFQAVLRTS